jgi:hypothetical protein
MLDKIILNIVLILIIIFSIFIRFFISYKASKVKGIKYFKIKLKQFIIIIVTIYNILTKYETNIINNKEAKSFNHRACMILMFEAG